MVERGDWPDRASRFLKTELKRQGVTYDQLAVLLAKEGLEETKSSIANKVSRGTFTGGFLMAALKVIGVQMIRVEDF